MRIFMNQTNVLSTTPVLDNNGEPVVDATITARILDSSSVEVPDSEVVLNHVAGGIYSEVVPMLEELVLNGDYYLEVTVEVSGIAVWYLKEPTKAIIRGTQHP